MKLRDTAGLAKRLGGLVLGCASGAAVLLLALAVVERGGMPSSMAGGIFATGAAALLVVIALSWRTLRLKRFLAADEAFPALPNGAAGALGAFPCGAALAGGAFVLAVGWPGLLALAVGFGWAALLGSALRQAKALSLADYLGLRFGRVARGFAVAAVFAACLCLAVAAMLAFMTVAGRGLGLGPSSAAALAGGAALLATLPGGLLSLTAFAGAALGLAALGGVVALLFGAKLIGIGASPWLAPLYGVLGPEEPLALLGRASALFAMPGGFARLAMLVVLAAGLASAPHVLVRAAAAEDRAAAAAALGWSFALMAFLALCGAAAAVISGLYLDDIVADRTLAGQAPAVRDLVQAGMLRLCGAGSWEAARAACGTRVLRASDIALDPSLALLGLPKLAGLPGSFNGLVLIGAAADLVAGLAAVLLAAALAGTYDLFNALLPTSLGESRTLALARLALIVLAALAARLAVAGGLDPWSPVLLGLAFLASTLFPALSLSILSTRVHPQAVSAAMGAGLAATVLGVVFFGLSAAPQSGLAGLVVGFAVGFAAQGHRVAQDWMMRFSDRQPRA
jgi:Na+(H+)/acetate symporter ActP